MSDLAVLRRTPHVDTQNGQVDTDASVYQQIRVGTGFAELDRVLGGGFVPGSVVLIGGDPRCGEKYLAAAGVYGVSPASGGIIRHRRRVPPAVGTASPASAATHGTPKRCRRNPCGGYRAIG